MHKKFGEESAELIIDYLKGTKKRTIEEATDLIYHLFVLLSSKKISYKDIQKELTKRQKETLKKHSKHLSSKHMTSMKNDMKKGMSFSKSHKKAMKKVGA